MASQLKLVSNTRKILGMIETKAFKYVYIKGGFKMLAVRNKYKPRYKTIIRIRDGDY